MSIRLLIDAGAGNESREAAGVAALTSQVLAEGTVRLDGASLAEEFERLGGSLSITASWDGVHVATTVLRDRFDSMLRLMGEVLLTPAFPEREIVRLREERLAELLELRAEPRGLADEMFERFLYPTFSRFSLPEAGSPETVEVLTRAQVQLYYDTRFRAAATTVIVAGDIDVEDTLGQVRVVFGDWSTPPPPASPADTVARSEQRMIHLVCRREAPQTELRVGHIGISRRHPDYFNAVVMNAILGGVFNSRINLNLRERHGYTYGASSFFDWRRVPGPFTVSTAVATDVTAPAITEILRELDGMHRTPPDAEELSLSVSYLEGVFPIRFETTEAISAALANLKTFDLPNDYYDTYRMRIAAVTSEDVQRAARDHLQPDQVQIIAVGDPQLGTRLESLGAGPVLYRSAKGDPIEKPL